MEGPAYFFTCLLQVLSATVLLLATCASCDNHDNICGQICPPRGSVSGWNRRCYITESTGCGYIPETNGMPTAPTNLQPEGYLYDVNDETKTLALNITWQLPANASGLTGFVVELMEIYPRGYQRCKQITFDDALGLHPQFTSAVRFSVACWHNIDVDSKYNITVRSLDSGQVVFTNYHTKNCDEVPSVGSCPDGKTTSDLWKPRNIPTARLYGDRVEVEFDTYPGNYWLEYRVNLHSYALNRTPPELSHHINTDGSSLKYTETFHDVKPGRYKAQVMIVSGTPGIPAYSDDFVVLAPLTPSPIGAKTTKAQATKRPRPDRNYISTAVGVGVGVVAAAAAVVLVAVVIANRKKWRGAGCEQEVVSESTPRDSPPSDDRADLVNNMECNDVDSTVGQGRSGRWDQVIGQEYQGREDSYLQGSLWTDFSDSPCVHAVQITDMGKLADLVSVGGESGIPV